VYYGELRGGYKGTILECVSCNVQALEDYSQDYVSGYREEVGNDDLKRHLPGITEIASIESAISGKVVMDIGASNGAYMEGVRSFAQKVIGVEPNTEQREDLSGRFDVYESVEKALEKHRGKVDSAMLWHVIEHISKPSEFLSRVSQLLAPDGKIYLSTPNTNDVLLRVLPDDFSKFFYRKWHSHYYKMDSLDNLISYSGLKAIFIRGYHSWGIGNILGWCRDKKPSTIEIEPHQQELMDYLWKEYINEVGLADTLYAVLGKNDGLH
jgi:SAM-dependent methyltransferase